MYLIMLNTFSYYKKILISLFLFAIYSILASFIEALGGSMWGSNWMERGLSRNGWYIDSWITRHVNGCLAKYI